MATPFKVQTKQASAATKLASVNTRQHNAKFHRRLGVNSERSGPVSQLHFARPFSQWPNAASFCLHPGQPRVHGHGLAKSDDATK